MKHRLWINIALLLAVILLGLFAYLKPLDGPPEHKLTTLKPGDADLLQVRIAGAEPVAVQRSGAEWRIVAPMNLRADTLQIQRLLGILDATSKDRFAPTGLARYDLNEPRASLTINKQTFSFGAVNEMSREQYVLAQDGVYLLPMRYGAALPKSALQLVSKQLFAAEESPVAFEFSNFRLAQQEGKWQLTPANDAAADDITRWVDEWRLAAALDVLPASNRKPLHTIKIKLKNGNDVTLSVLEQEPALVLARGDQAVEYQLSGAAAKRLLAAPAVAPPAPAPAK